MRIPVLRNRPPPPIPARCRLSVALPCSPSSPPASPCSRARRSAAILARRLAAVHARTRRTSASTTRATTTRRLGDHADARPATSPRCAERAYAAELADGYPRPPSDAARRRRRAIDIYVDDLSREHRRQLRATRSGTSTCTTTSGFIELAGEPAAEDGVQPSTRSRTSCSTSSSSASGCRGQATSDDWLFEASAEWMGFRVDGYRLRARPASARPTCRSTAATRSARNQCDLHRRLSRTDGYSRWPFFEYLSEKYGPAFVKDIFAQGLAARRATALAALSSALAAKGTTLADTYNAWATAEMTSATPIARSRLQRPQLCNAPIFTGVATQTGTVRRSRRRSRSTTSRRGTSSSTAAPRSAARLATTCCAGNARPDGDDSRRARSRSRSSTGTGRHRSPRRSASTATRPPRRSRGTRAPGPTGEGFLSLPNASSPSTNVDARRLRRHREAHRSHPLVQVTSVIPRDPAARRLVTGPVISVGSRGRRADDLRLRAGAAQAVADDVPDPADRQLERPGQGAARSLGSHVARHRDAARRQQRPSLHDPEGHARERPPLSAAASNVLTLTPDLDERRRRPASR